MSHSQDRAHAHPSASSGAALLRVQAARNARAVWLGFGVAVVGYLVLSMQQPAGWGPALWSMLALLAVPAVSGLVINRTQASDRPIGRAFFAGVKASGWAMFFYATITLIVLANRLGRPDGGSEEFLAGLLTTIVFTVIAGAVAGAVNMMLTRMTGTRS